MTAERVGFAPSVDPKTLRESILLRVPVEAEGKARLIVRTYPSRPKNMAALQDRVAWQFHLDADLTGFYRKAMRHVLFRPLLKTLYGVKPLRPATLFEMAVIAITEQQLSYEIAVKMRSRMVEARRRAQNATPINVISTPTENRSEDTASFRSSSGVQRPASPPKAAMYRATQRRDIPSEYRPKNRHLCPGRPPARGTRDAASLSG